MNWNQLFNIELFFICFQYFQLFIKQPCQKTEMSSIADESILARPHLISSHTLHFCLDLLSLPPDKMSWISFLSRYSQTYWSLWPLGGPRYRARPGPVRVLDGLTHFAHSEPRVGFLGIKPYFLGNIMAWNVPCQARTTPMAINSIMMWQVSL